MATSVLPNAWRWRLVILCQRRMWETWRIRISTELSTTQKKPSWGMGQSWGTTMGVLLLRRWSRSIIVLFQLAIHCFWGWIIFEPGYTLILSPNCEIFQYLGVLSSLLMLEASHQHQQLRIADHWRREDFLELQGPQWIFPTPRVVSWLSTSAWCEQCWFCPVSKHMPH